MKHLILNADDFGVSKAHNDAIIHLLTERKISSTTLIPTAPAYRQAIEWAVAHPQYHVGLHLTFTSEWFDPAYRWGSLTHAASIDTELCNTMPKDIPTFEKNATDEEVASEIKAQFARLENDGHKISHVDNHMGSIYGLATGRMLLPYVFEECIKRGVGFRLPKIAYCEYPGQPSVAPMPDGVKEFCAKNGIFIPDYLLYHDFSDKFGESYEDFKAMLIDKLSRLEEGYVYETFIHPAMDCDEIRLVTDTWQKRVWEYQIMFDPDIDKALNDFDIQLITYEDAAGMR